MRKYLLIVLSLLFYFPSSYGKTLEGVAFVLTPAAAVSDVFEELRNFMEEAVDTLRITVIEGSFHFYQPEPDVGMQDFRYRSGCGQRDFSAVHTHYFENDLEVNSLSFQCAGESWTLWFKRPKAVIKLDAVQFLQMKWTEKNKIEKVESFQIYHESSNTLITRKKSMLKDQMVLSQTVGLQYGSLEIELNQVQGRDHYVGRFFKEGSVLADLVMTQKEVPDSLPMREFFDLKRGDELGINSFKSQYESNVSGIMGLIIPGSLF